MIVSFSLSVTLAPASAASFATRRSSEGDTTAAGAGGPKAEAEVGEEDDTMIRLVLE